MRQEWLLHTPETVFNGHYPKGKINTVLDVGCGLSCKSQFIDAQVRVGVDIYRPYLLKAQEQATDKNLILIQGDVTRLDEMFLPNSFDMVMLQDVIEHFEKDTASHILSMAQSIAKVAVFVQTPRGFVFQNIDILGMGGDEFQTHRSAWYEGDLIARGFEVVTRDYLMTDVKRHTDYYQEPHIHTLNAIWRKTCA